MTKEINELSFPEEIRYTDDHEWAKKEGDVIKVGITDYAQDQLGDIVFAEMPQVGDTFEKGAEFGTLESVKAVSELYLPVGGEILTVNEAIADAPELVNTDPYGGGWMLTIKPSDAGEFDALMDRKAYIAVLKG